MSRTPIRVLLTNDDSVQIQFPMTSRKAPSEKRSWSFHYDFDLTKLFEENKYLHNSEGMLRSFIVKIDNEECRALLLIRRLPAFVGVYVFDPFENTPRKLVNEAIDMLYDTGMINQYDVVAIYFIDITYPCEDERKDGIIPEVVKEFSNICLQEWEGPPEKIIRSACTRGLHNANMKFCNKKIN